MTIQRYSFIQRDADWDESVVDADGAWVRWDDIRGRLEMARAALLHAADCADLPSDAKRYREVLDSLRVKE